MPIGRQPTPKEHIERAARGCGSGKDAVAATASKRLWRASVGGEPSRRKDSKMSTEKLQLRICAETPPVEIDLGDGWCDPPNSRDIVIRPGMALHWGGNTILRLEHDEEFGLRLETNLRVT